MWHKNRYFAEAVASSLVRFAAPGSSRHHRSPHSRRVFGQKRGITKGNAPRILNRPHKCKGGFQRCSRLVGRLGCCDLSTTTRGACGSNSFLNINLARVDAIVRRADSLSLGDYTLGQFKQESKRLGDELDASSW